jgi:hypothetical protein
VHDIGTIYYPCDQPGCNFTAKQRSAVKIHKMHTHNIGVSIFKCDFKDCNYECKEIGRLRKHKRFNHDVGTVWFSCDVEGCDYSCKQRANIRVHKINKHGVNITYHYCDIPDCDFKTKHAYGITSHKMNVHEIGVVWKYCDIDSCSYRAKRKLDIKQHKASIHNIDIRWTLCPQPNCTYQTKTNNIRRHLSLMHDIGDYQCELCIRNCAALTEWEDSKTNQTLNICRKCYRKATGYKTRIEKVLVEYLRDNFPHPMIKQDQRVNGEACLAYRPDIMYACPKTNLVIYIEIDEHQHKYSSSDYNCDERRMSELYDETPGKHVVFIRYNPHKYKVPSNKKSLDDDDRMKLLLDILNNVIDNHNKIRPHMFVYYVCYSKNNKLIAKNIPNVLVYDAEMVKEKPSNNKILVKGKKRMAKAKKNKL